MKYDLIIKNGRVILDDDVKEVEVAVKDGKIAAIGNDLGEAEKVIDAEGQIVSPGMVDAHVFISLNLAEVTVMSGKVTKQV